MAWSTRWSESVKKYRNEVYKRSQSFAEKFFAETSLHGFKELQRAQSYPGRIFWFLIILAGLTLAIYLIVVGFINFISMPISTSVSIKALAEFEIPFLYCPEKYIDKGRIIALNISSDVLAYALSYLCGLGKEGSLNHTLLDFTTVYPGIEKPYISVTTLPQTVNKYNALIKSNNFTTAFDLLLAITVSVSAIQVSGDVTVYDTYKHMNTIQSRFFNVTPYMTGQGFCFAGKFPVFDDIGDIFQRTHLDYLPSLDEQLFNITYTRSPNYVAIEFGHRIDDLLFIGDEANAFIPDIAKAIVIQDSYNEIFISEIVNYTRVSRSSQRCREYTMAGQPYLKRECMQECYTRAKRQCTPLGLSVLQPPVKTDRETCKFGSKYHSNPSAEKFLNCLDSCYVPCKETRMRLDIGNAVLADSLKHMGEGERLPNDTISENNSETKMVQISVSRTVTDIVEFPSYTWDTLVGVIGGQLGLWMGASLLSIFELIYYLSAKCLKHQTKKQTSVVDFNRELSQISKYGVVVDSALLSNPVYQIYYC